MNRGVKLCPYGNDTFSIDIFGNKIQVKIFSTLVLYFQEKFNVKLLSQRKSSRFEMTGWRKNKFYSVAYF